MINHANINQMKVGVTVLSSDEVFFIAKKITRDREGHYIMKSSIN